ncbi:phosphatidylserine/phosphatidylglycerophosphate/cardiolipin synthase-like enzyme [Caballeronia udeis]|uniref:Phosphatidylserine/phosphatidylglycerophosphate/ cardiolipin synthase-like enzyme n=1 Tax=Caballeronia udeis TaxID=1232866 RepID=A0ABW8MGY0_9BURK
MSTKCIALSNNDVILVAWTFDHKLSGCVGFDVRRINASDAKLDISTPQGVSLPAMAGFPSDPNSGHTGQTTAQGPIQKFFWKDLFVKDAHKQGTYVYQIIPLQGAFSKDAPPKLAALAGAPVLYSNPVSLAAEHGPKDDPEAITCYFNRGILATQAVARQLPKSKSDLPDSGALLKRIADASDPLRKSLAGDLVTVLPSLLAEAKAQGGSCYGALYELADKQLEASLVGNKQLHLILSNTYDSTSHDDDKENAPAREALHHSGVDVTDRMLPDGSHIGHNKFMLYVDAKSTPASVLTGSTNWTPTGLCAQTNNSIVFRSPSLASAYSTYWDALKKDTLDAGTDPHALQSKAFRTANASPVTVQVPGARKTTLWFSPNTLQKNKAKGVTPPDMADVYARIEAAKSAVLFLAFDPGQPSIIDAAASAQEKNQKLFIRGALTNADRAGNFVIDLHNNNSKPTDPAQVIPAQGVNDAFGVWEKELARAGHAVIHDKIVVIDPFDPERCTVVVGSHNLGNKASSTNDENLVIIEGNVSLACAYAVHVLDVYDHYRWRYLLAQHGTKDSWQGLHEDDSWQASYFSSTGHASNAELAFWLGAPAGGTGQQSKAAPARVHALEH